MAKKVVVVRIGSRVIHIAHMENTANEPAIYGCIRVPTPENSVQDGMLLDTVQLARWIQKACRDKKINTKDVIFTVASSKIASRETVIPAVSKAKIKEVILAKVGDLFPVDTDKYIFTYDLQGEPREEEGNGKVQDVRVFAAPADMIDSYYALADAMGMHIVAVESDTNSVFQIMRRQVKDNVSMAVQIGRSSTSINVIGGGKLLLQRVIPYGVSVFTDVMVQEPVFQTPDFDKAYQVLTTQKVLLHSLNEENPTNDFSIAKRIEVTENSSYLIGNIGRVMEYYNSRYKEQPIQEIICIGAGCSVAGIHELLENELGITVVTPQSIQGVRFNKKRKVDAAILQYLNCFGAVFSPVKFVPKLIAMKEARKGSLTGAVLIFVLCFVASAAIAVFSYLQLFTAEDERDVWVSRQQQLAPVQGEYDELMKIDEDKAKVLLIDHWVDSNNNHLPQILERFSNMVPKSFRINSISTTEDSATVNATTSDKLLSVSALQMQLNNIVEIDNVKIDTISENTDSVTKMRQYTYSFTFDFVKKAEVSEEE